jgi:hypothetical protein
LFFVSGKRKSSGQKFGDKAPAGKIRTVAFRSAFEDFEKTSLVAVPGLLGKLYYLSELHDGRGGYSHWGMNRVYGTYAAERAIGTSHKAILTKVLRAPLRVLVDDLRRSAANAQLSAADFIAALKKRTSALLPQGSMAASQKHAMAVLQALSALVEGQDDATPQGASRLPRLVR